MQNAEIARLLGEVADLLEISAGNPFKVRAYRNAARTVADHPDPVAQLVKEEAFDLTALPGIGGGIAKEITALLETGALPQRQQLVATIPPGLLDLLRIPGLGPKRVKLFHDELKVNSIADLQRALEAGKIAKLGGFGPKLLEKIREGVAGAAAGTGQRRMVLHEAEQYARAIVEYLKAGGGIDTIEVAGSFRRRKETIGDLDIVVSGANAPDLISRFGKFGEVTHVASQGDTRSTVRLSSGLQVDLRVIEPACFGAALQYFTGSQAHNIELRKIAQAKKLKLNEYGLYRGSKCIGGRTGQEVYAALGLDWVPPGLRGGRNEIALAREHKLPDPITLEQGRGDLQMAIGAIENPWVDAIGHPTGRILPNRPSYSLDFDVVAKAAANAKCLLEINGSERLDLPDTLAAAAKSHGVRFVLSTDAHNQRELGFMRFAVSVARRAGLTAADVMNTRPLPEFLKSLKRARHR